MKQERISKCCKVNESRFGTCANCGLPFESDSMENLEQIWDKHHHTGQVINGEAMPDTMYFENAMAALKEAYSLGIQDGLKLALTVIPNVKSYRCSDCSSSYECDCHIKSAIFNSCRTEWSDNISKLISGEQGRTLETDGKGKLDWTSGEMED